MPALPRRPALAVAALAVVLAFGFLGTRGLWDPDEGRYTNVALNMLASGDWIDPMRNAEVGHWTKPPMTYWAIAASVALFGRNPWAARLPIALSFLACVALTWRLARRTSPGAEPSAALVYATMLFPLAASQVVTTDSPLAALETLAMLGYVESRFGAAAASDRWLTLMWGAFGLAFMTKGPPALLPLLPILVQEILVGTRPRRPLLRWHHALVFSLVALPWYVAVAARHPGLLGYLLGTEVVGRVATDEFRRHGEWYGWLTIYAPTLLLGTLPWTPALWRWARSLPAQVRGWRGRADDPGLLLALWVALPLVVFCLSRSRLPLYVLPLFVPLALLAARQRQQEARTTPRAAGIVAWGALLLALKLAGAYWPSDQDASAWASAIRERDASPVREVVFVEDMARYGLHLHLAAQVERVSLEPGARSKFNPEFDGDLAAELSEREAGAVYVTRQDRWPAVRQRIEAEGDRVEVLGAPYDGRVLFTVAFGSPTSIPDGAGRR